MDTDSLTSWHGLSRLLVRYLGVYLIYLAVLIRFIHQYADSRYWGPMLAMLVIYGLFLVLETWLPRRPAWYPQVYLVLQSGLAMGLLLFPPHEDFLPMLFIPLCLQAVLFFDRRAGLICTLAFSLALAGPMMITWDWELTGLVMVLLYGGLFYLIVNYAHLIQRAEAARHENQALIQALQVAGRQLQDYAAQVEEFSVAQERSRLARELHDSATQTIFSMNLTAQAARLLVEKEPDRVASQLDRLQELVQGAIGEIRVLVSQLQPRSLAQEGLPAALHRLVAEREARDGLRIRLEISGEKELPEPAIVGLYRIAQEALNNVARHAGTRDALVRLNLAGERLVLEIEDGGVGFDPGGVPLQSGHVGLTGMAERARELGWRLSCDSQPGHGTRIRVEEM